MFIVNLIRLIIALLAGGIVLLLGLVNHVITWVIGRWDPAACDRIRWNYVKRSTQVIWFLCGGPTTVVGTENIPTDRPVVFVGNHRSILDIILSISKLPIPAGFIAKQELGRVPLLRVLMRDIHCFFLDRQDPRNGLKTILAAIDFVKNGGNVFIYPEGTRCKEEGTMLPFHAGSFKTATKPGATIVPVTVVNIGDVMADHSPWLKWVPVVIDFGEPIETSGMDRQAQKELPDQLRDQMLATYAKYSEQIREQKEQKAA